MGTWPLPVPIEPCAITLPLGVWGGLHAGWIAEAFTVLGIPHVAGISLR